MFKECLQKYQVLLSEEQKKLKEVENHRFRLLREKEEQRKEIEELRSSHTMKRQLVMEQNVHNFSRDQRKVTLSRSNTLFVSIEANEKNNTESQTEDI